MYNTRTTLAMSRANRRAHQFRSRGRVRPRRPGLSKVVDVVFNSNDALGTTIGSKSNGKYSAAVLSAFGESLETLQCEATSNFKHQTSNSQTFFTGKPMVEGLGHAFWMRNYRAGLAKWQTADPMGYPDGWNQLAYCNNGVTGALDLWGCRQVDLREIVVGDKKPPRLEKWGPVYQYDYYHNGTLYWCQDRAVIDDNQYARIYRNTKMVPANQWLHEIADGFTDVGEAAMAIAAAGALLPDPIPLTKAGEITAAGLLGASGAVEWLIGKVLKLFDNEIEVWDGMEYQGAPYKHEWFDKKTNQPYIRLIRLAE